MRRGVEQTEETPGGDSFLDVVANVVGILVLLVVLVGVRAAKVATEEVAAAKPLEVEPVEAVAQRAQQAKQDLRRDEAGLLELRERVLAAEAEAERREAAREDATWYVTKLRAELDDARSKLDEGDLRSHDTHNAIAQAQLTLERLAREQIALAADAPDPEQETVVVAPTPIVDGRAERTVSFRLQGDRLVYVPVEELELELAKRLEAPALADPTQRAVVRETVGPVGGFLAVADIGWAVRASGGRIGVRAEVLRMLLREVTRLDGESLDQAFAPGGYVASRVELLDPDQFVIRLMVYADSFDSAPEAERRFRERGFRIAKSLKSNGEPIGFSSSGYHAVTQ